MKLTLRVGALLAGTLLFGASLVGQDNNDCVNATVICSDADISFNPTGPGANDFADPDNFDGCLGGENQSSWYFVEIRDDAPANLQLGFTIDPDAGGGQDYDFAVYGPDVPCDDLGSPIRCSYAAGFCAFCPLTGLGMGQTDLSESPGGNGFVRVLDVQPGEGYYILIDNFSNNSTGFSLSWTGSAASWLDCLDCIADAGELSADPQPTCPGTTVTFSVANYNTDPDYTQLLLIADANGDITEILSTTSGALSSADCAEFTVYSYNYETTGTAVVPSVGDNVSVLVCGGDVCCDLSDLPVSFTDDEDPTFPFAPADETLICSDLVPPLEDQEWVDNCDGNGIVSGSETGAADPCSGGGYTRTWTYTDVCGNEGTHTQNIIVEPAPEPFFLNPPADQTVSCDAAPTEPGTGLSYTNDANGACEILGTVFPIRSGSSDVCGGEIFYTWEATDPCGRTITHVQTFTVEPAPEASFTDPPADYSISCADLPGLTAPDLSYTNGLAGTCAIAGTASPVQSGAVDACGGEVLFTWSFTDDCGRTVEHVQTVTVEPAPEAFFFDPPGDLTFSCDNLPTLGAPDLSYTNGAAGSCALDGSVAAVQDGFFTVCGGTVTYTWTFTDDCGRTIEHVQSVTVTPGPEAMFRDAPADVTIACHELPDANALDLAYDNALTGDCSIFGQVQPTVSGFADVCGGEVIYDWVYTDPCGRTISHQQVITVEPGPDPVFLDPPADVTVSCDEFTDEAPELTYDNGTVGDCELFGFVSPTVSGTIGSCGGVRTYDWTYTDPCGRMISHQQTVTVEPAGDAAFIDLPADLALDCGADFPDAVELFYANDATGSCSDFGFVVPQVLDLGPAERQYIWTYDNPCSGTTISHTQRITRTDGPDFTLAPTAATICAGESFDLAALELTDQSGGNPTVTYHDDSPAGPGNELAGTTVSPSATTVYYLLATDATGCADEAAFTLTVEQSPNAGTDGAATVCFERAGAVDLPAILGGSPDADGEWSDPGGTGVVLTDPAAVDLTGLAGGDYTFVYTVTGAAECPEETASATVTLLPPVAATLGDLLCSDDLLTYTVVVQSNGYDLSATSGTLTDVGGGTFELNGVSIDDAVTIIASDPADAGCFSEITVSPPDCNCPNVAAPLAEPVDAVCAGADNPELTVTVDDGSTADWYTEAAGGTLLVSGSTTFTSPEVQPGVYTYFVETRNPTDGCVSAVRTAVSFEIAALPVGNDVTLSVCDDDQDGLSTFDLDEAIPLVGDGPFTVRFLPLVDGTPDFDNPLPAAYQNGSGPTEALAIEITNAAGCFALVDLTLTVHLAPTFDAFSTGESCFGAADGTISAVATNGVRFRLDDGPWSADPAFTDLAPGTYELFAESAEGCLTSSPVVVASGSELRLDDFTAACDDGGTPSDPADDTYLVSFTPNNSLGEAGSCTVDDGSESWGSFTYGEPQSRSIPAGGGAFTLTATDDVRGCTVSREVAAQPSCSPECLLTVEFFENNCSDNGTETDPDDDLYTVTLLATAMNGAAAGSYAVTMGGTSLGEFTYGDTARFQLPADGSSVLLELRDTEDTGCGADLPLGPLTACSGSCVLSPAVTDILCNDGGTPTDPLDDTFTFTLTVTASNAGSGWTENITGTGGDYGTPVGFGPFLIADGDRSLTVIDNDNAGCPVTLPAPAPAPCSDSCALEITAFERVCDDGGTVFDQADDGYRITIGASAANGSERFIVLIDGMVVDSFFYAAGGTIFLPADGSSPTLTVRDGERADCFEDRILLSLEPCTEPCEIFPVLVRTDCDGAETNDPSDDLFRAAVVVTGANTSGSWGLAESGGGYNYGDTVVLGPYLIADGDQTLVIQDTGNGGCAAELTLPAPPACSPVCTLAVTSFERNCNDNGTVAIQDDDFYEFTLVAAAENGAPDGSFELMVNGELTATGTYGVALTFTLPADGDDRILVLRDADYPDCTNALTTGPLPPCTDACQLSVTFSEVVCDDAGTGNDATDDTFQFVLSVSGQNTGPGWQSPDGTLGSGYGGSVTAGPYPIAAGGAVVTVEDLQNSACRSIVTVPPPPACSSCDQTVDAGPDVELTCAEPEAFLLGTASQGGNYNWWLEGVLIANEQGASITEPGIYRFVVDFPDGCAAEDSMMVSDAMDGPRIAQIEVVQERCAGEDNGRIVVEEVDGGEPPYSYLFNGQQINTAGFFTQLSPGDYQINITDDNGCQYDTLISITPGPELTIGDPIFLDVIRGDSGTISIDVGVPENELRYVQWTPPDQLSCDTCLTTNFSSDQSQNYRLDVEHLNGCAAFTTVQLLVAQNLDVYLPTAFSPDGNGTNDFFTVFAESRVVQVRNMTLFDRWGEQVFRSDDFPPNEPELGWDGTFDGRPLNPAVFVYSITLLLNDNSEVTIKGDVTLMR